ncbi:MAG: phosphoenolpyruvate--protein phosphotransferase [candidate division Zixibacteria bacterium]|nr:phosphoenolpyruvate--protein phosphotransferase [candidate division Zixibacteria bacterium]
MRDIHKEEIILKGIPVSGGVALGEAQVLRDPSFQIVRRQIPASQIQEELARLDKAREKAIGELQGDKSKAIKAVGEQAAKVFEAQVMIASDQQFFQAVADRIVAERINAEYAYQEATAATLDRLMKSKDPYLRQMVHDIAAVSDRILSFLLGVGTGGENGFANPTILAGRIFSPGQIMAYAKRNVVGFLTEEGGPTSHMALIIRSLGIPSVMGDFSVGEKLVAGMQLIIDGNSGDVIINPDIETTKNYRRMRARKLTQPFGVLLNARSIAAVCRDGREIALAANLEIPGPVDEHLVRLRIGVGLFRTEFLYFNKQTFPDEEEQYQVYSAIAKKFNPLPVTLRTFDLGGDKYAEEFGKVHEDNPALGWRGIRVSLDATRLFKTQLRAMLRASAEGNVKILLPMVSDVGEINETLELVDKIKRELRRTGIPHNDGIAIGAMIEIPSAAMSADYLAQKVDFLSIGTNDLIQYTMAADRGNFRVAKYYLGHHPAVLQLIHMTVQAGHENGVAVTVCGEMAGAKLMAPFLVGMGVDELSMNPTRLPELAEWISRFRYSDAKRFASRVMRLSTADKVMAALKEAYDYVDKLKQGDWRDEQP